MWTPPGEPDERYPTNLGAQYAIDEFLDQARRDHAPTTATTATAAAGAQAATTAGSVINDRAAVNAALDAYERQTAWYQ